MKLEILKRFKKRNKSVACLNVQTEHTTKLSAFMHYVKQKTWKRIAQAKKQRQEKQTQKQEGSSYIDILARSLGSYSPSWKWDIWQTVCMWSETRFHFTWCVDITTTINITCYHYIMKAKSIAFAKKISSMNCQTFALILLLETYNMVQHWLVFLACL